MESQRNDARARSSWNSTSMEKLNLPFGNLQFGLTYHACVLPFALVGRHIYCVLILNNQPYSQNRLEVLSSVWTAHQCSYENLPFLNHDPN